MERCKKIMEYNLKEWVARVDHFYLALRGLIIWMKAKSIVFVM
jgi:hypothetical protein